MTKEDEVKHQLKWRLSERPTVESIEKLVNLRVITTIEAKQLLVEEDEIRPKTFKDLEKEIELLRELVLDLAKREPKTSIEIIERHFDHYYPKYIPTRQIDPYWVEPLRWMCNTAETINYSVGDNVKKAFTMLNNPSGEWTSTFKNQ